MPFRAVSLVPILLGLSIAAARAGAEPAPAGPSGLPIPRFVSLAADQVNLRAGPGFRYPVAWVFLRRSMPVEVVGEFDQWRRIRDREGAEGWTHKALLSGRRTVVVVGGERVLRRAPEAAAAPLARAEPGVQGRLFRCAGEWCEVRLSRFRGWMERRHLWGVHDGERVE